MLSRVQRENHPDHRLAPPPLRAPCPGGFDQCREPRFTSSGVPWQGSSSAYRRFEIASLFGRRLKGLSRMKGTFTSGSERAGQPQGCLATRYYRAIGGARTFTSQGSQHCRLLLSFEGFSPGGRLGVLDCNCAVIGFGLHRDFLPIDLHLPVVPRGGVFFWTRERQCFAKRLRQAGIWKANSADASEWRDVSCDRKRMRVILAHALVARGFSRGNGRATWRSIPTKMTVWWFAVAVSRASPTVWTHYCT